jgi:hypothetical protein
MLLMLIAPHGALHVGWARPLAAHDRALTPHESATAGAQPRASVMVPHAKTRLPLALAAAAVANSPLCATAAEFGASGGVSFNLIYGACVAGIYACIYAQGRGNVVMRGGVVFKDGKPVAQPFKRTAEASALAAVEALRQNEDEDSRESS